MRDPCKACAKRAGCEKRGNFRACRDYRARLDWALESCRRHLGQLPKSPCEFCGEDCQEPCRAYLRWYDARMEIFRRRWRLEA